MSEYAVMPMEDYLGICNAVRAKTGEEFLLKSGEIAAAIDAIESGTEVIPFRESDENNPIRICAHRGFHAYAVENTAPAVLAALNTGFGIIECDIYVSADGVYYVNHNSTVTDIHGEARAIQSLTSEELDSLVVVPPTETGGFSKINVPQRMTRLSEVLEAAELVDRDYELWLELKNINGTTAPAFIEYLNQNVSAATRNKLRLFGGNTNAYLHSNKVWDRTLYYGASLEPTKIYEGCVAAQELGIDALAYTSREKSNLELGDSYYAQYGIKTAVYTISAYGLFGTFLQHPCVKFVCADNMANWNWQEYFQYKEETEFQNVETWDFATDATSNEGTAFTTSGTFTYGDGVTFDSESSYMWLNLPIGTKTEGVAEFEFTCTPTTTNQRIFHIGSANGGNYLCARVDKLAFYDLGNDWFHVNYPAVLTETETYKAKVYWNAYSFIVFVDDKPFGSDIILFSAATTSAGRNFCLGSTKTSFLGTIRNLKMWY